MGSETLSSSRRSAAAWYVWFNRLLVTTIPNVTQIRKELDYGHAHERRDITFWNEVRSFPYKFTSASGIHGQDLNKWRYRIHQDGLLEMADKFLELEGKGQQYWPDSSDLGNFRKLQYSKEPKKIKRLLIQLFFKLIQQARWKGSHRGLADRIALETEEGESSASAVNTSPSSAERESGPDSSFESRSCRATSQRGFERGDPINIDDQGVEEFLPAPRDAASGLLPEPPAQYMRGSFQPVSEESDATNTENFGMPQEASLGPKQNPTAPVAPMEDPYEVPVSPRPMSPRTTPQGANSGKRAATSNHNEKTPRTKRHRSGPSEPSASEEANTEPVHHLTGQAAGARAQRLRNRPAAPGLVMGAEYNDVLNELRRQSPVSGSESGLESEMDNLQSLYEPTELMFSPPRAQEIPRQGPSVANGDTQTSPSQHQTGRAPQEGFNPQPTIQNNQETLKRAPLALPKVNLTYSVMVSSVLNRRWTPRGSFRHKSLSELVSELPVTCTFKVLTFSLETPGGTKYEENVSIEDDDGFDVIKTRFREKVRRCQQDHAKSKRVLNFEIVITPLSYDEDDLQDMGEEDDFNL